VTRFLHPSLSGELRAHHDGAELTIERREAEGCPWVQLTFGELVSLGATGGPVASWLTRVGVPYGGATEKDYREVARFNI
jgi:hypothetical protein